ncbi:MAG: Gfo/Idh/MocA family oxidoreductase, partial [Deltaproteobacteria bacterium]|nr:Gfo/Idh/MocA family oxidoreductase [Deltaproteobacteria bacterium]
MINIAVIGAGYWGPNLIRNFVTCPKTRVTWVCDLDRIRLAEVLAPYPDIKQTADYQEILADDHVDAVAIATPVHTHFPIAGDCLKAGKHVLVEKPLADSVAEGEALVDLADETGLVLMCDHTFCYTGAVLKIKEIIESGLLGELLYYDSVRINLGLFQQDINVVWDLAPHDLSILDYLIEKDPLQVSAHGICHAGNNIENMAYMTLYYHDSFISHFHL